MKNFFWIFASALLFANFFLSTGCAEDDTTGGGGVDLPPLVVVTDTPTDAFTSQDETMTVTVEVTKGTAPLKALKITEDGVNVAAARIEIAELNGVANNPQLITGGDVDGFTWTVSINVQDAFDTREYVISVEDDNGLTDSQAFDVTVEDPGTPLQGDLTGVLFNQAGPAGKGAIDLDSGNGTGVSTGDPATGTEPEDAELRDMGIDQSQPVSQNWRKKIAGMNNSIVRVLTTPSAENFDFDAVNTQEQIAAEWDAADSFTDELSGMPVSDVVQEGDIFLVERADGRLYMIRVDEVNETTDNNQDNYVLSIKY